MRFDEQQIHGFSLRVPTKTIEIDIPLLMDEKVEVVIQGQIEEVTMRVDKKTGELIRRHVLTIDDMEVRA